VSEEESSGRAVWAAIGGVRGIVEAVLPGLAFVVLYVATQQTLLSVLIPLAISLVLLGVRVIQRQPVLSAIGGVLLLAVSATIALLTGNASDAFVVGFFINGIWLVMILVSLAARWPVVGALIGAMTGRVTGWRADERFRRGATAASWVWAALFAVRLAVELPLYFAQQTAALGVARLVTGVPLYAVAVLVTWLLLRTPKGAAETSTTEG